MKEQESDGMVSDGMVNVNGVTVPTCAQLAKALEKYGDQPLFSGNGWWCVYGFGPVQGGVQIAAKRCDPRYAGNVGNGRNR